MLLSAQLVVGDAAMPVIIRNLSSEGALIEGKRLPFVGQAAIFKRNALSVPGRLVWIHDQMAGLAFDQPLDRQALLREMPAPKHRFEQQFRRPGLACQPLNDADRKMLEMWSTRPR